MKGILFNKNWTRRLNISLVTFILVSMSGATCLAASIGAITNGNWNNTSTWTPAQMPVSADYVYIGSTYPSGAAASATVTMVQDQSANTVYLGYGSGTSGTLDLGNYKLSVGGTIYLGYSAGSAATVNRGSGYFSTYSLNQNYGSTFTFGSSDTASNLTMANSSTASTIATGNVSASASIQSGSTLTLGANMTLTSNLNLQDNGSTMDLANHELRANEIDIGWSGTGSPSLLNRGKLTASSLWVANLACNINSTDAITNFHLQNGTSTLNAPVASLYLTNNSTAATTSAGGITAGATIDSGSHLTLGADAAMTGTLDLRTTGSTFDMASHALTASTVYLGWNGTGLTTLQNRGRLTAGSLYVANQPFDLNATDVITNFSLQNGAGTLNAPVSSLSLTTNATATTTAAGNVSSYVNISGGSRLTLGADMTLSGSLNMWNAASTLDMAGHSLKAYEIDIGWNATGSTTLMNNGKISTNNLYVAHANTPTFHPGDSIGNYAYLSNSSILTVSQANDQLTGLTFNGTYSGSLSINDTSVLSLQIGQSPFTHWIFRWKNPNSTSNWSNVLTNLITAGRISINPSTGYYLANQGGYTYIYAVTTPVNFDWKGGDIAGPTDWSLSANWNPNTGTPYGQGIFLSFGNQPSTNNIVDMGSSGKTVGGLVFVSATSTTIQSTGGHDLTLDNNSHISTIDVTGNHFITTPVILNNDAQIEGLGTLTASGGISGPHNLDVQGNVIVSSIVVDTLTMESGATVTIQAIPGGYYMGNTITAVPEPSTLVLMGIGSIGLFAYAWRRRKLVA
jgi:hypothetical protein